MGGLLTKPDTAKHTEDGASACGRWAYGVSSMQGWRKAQEDAHLAMPDFDVSRELGLFGVFDGHGGAAVAAVAARRLPETLRTLPAFKEGRFEEALDQAFLKLDAYLDSAKGRKEIDKEVANGPDVSDEEDKDEDEMLRDLVASGELTQEDADQMKKEGMQADAESEEEGEEEDAEEGEDEPVCANSAWAEGSGPDGMGCTSVVALVRRGSQPFVWCANAGDSRCVLMRGSKALALSKDHKPTNKVELTRIHKAGGFVTDEGRVDGNLNLSRALGDFAYKKDKTITPQEQKISCEAEIKSRPVLDTDRYLVLGCDGIFEKATNQALTDFLAPRLPTSAAPRKATDGALSVTMSAFLDHNIAKMPAKENGLGCDNMTLMVVDLQAGGAVKSAAGSPAEVVPAVQAASPAKPAPGSPKRQLSSPQVRRRSSAAFCGVRRGVIEKSNAPVSPRRRLLAEVGRQRRVKAAKA